MNSIELNPEAEYSHDLFGVKEDREEILRYKMNHIMQTAYEKDKNGNTTFVAHHFVSRFIKLAETDNEAAYLSFLAGKKLQEIETWMLKQKGISKIK